MILVEGNTAAEATEDATTKQPKNKYVPYEWRQPKDEIDQWIANNQETCLFCADPVLVPNFKDSVRDRDHMTGKYRGALTTNATLNSN